MRVIHFFAFIFVCCAFIVVATAQILINWINVTNIWFGDNLSKALDYLMAQAIIDKTKY